MVHVWRQHDELHQINLTPGGTSILDCTDEIDTTEISVFCQFLRFFLNSGIPVFTLKSIGCRPLKHFFVFSCE